MKEDHFKLLIFVINYFGNQTYYDLGNFYLNEN
jgi:hypothetical protein